MLRVLLHFHYVVVAVVRGDEVGLGAAAHFPDPGYGFERHQGKRKDTLISMAEETTQSNQESKEAREGRNTDEVALEMMKFIALTTGYGKPSGASAGFTGKAAKAGTEEYAEALLQLFDRCRRAVRNR